MAKLHDIPPPQEEGAPEWLTTFADLMSLLLCFFVLLLSFSVIDLRTYKLLYGSFADSFGVPGKQVTPKSGPGSGEKIIAKEFDTDPVSMKFMSTLQENLAKSLKEEAEAHLSGMENLVEVRLDEFNSQVTIQLMGESTFDSGSADIRPQMVPLLQKLGTILKDIDSNIIIGGHTDNVPISGWPYRNNLILSMSRAASVAEFLIGKAGVDGKRIATMGFGEYHPIDTNDTPTGRQRNRRVEITLASPGYQKYFRQVPEPDPNKPAANPIGPLDTPGDVIRRQ